MNNIVSHDFAVLHSSFQSPIATLNCGEHCAPHNEYGVPFCCDTHHAIPMAYQAEWDYLKSNTDLWHLWQGKSSALENELSSQAPDGQVLIACKGHLYCQRDFRSLTCRSFPFFPYFTPQGEFIGLSYFWEYEDRCWVISNLQIVSPEFKAQFIAMYLSLFEQMPDVKDTFKAFSDLMRQNFSRRHRTIPLLHRNGNYYKISPGDSSMREVPARKLPKFGVYKIAAQLPFQDEVGV
jgi:hypothetical protein